jgi:hypothetical protein
MTRAELILAEVERRGARIWIADQNRLKGTPAEVFEQDPQLCAAVARAYREIVAELQRQNPVYRQAVAIAVMRLLRETQLPRPPVACAYRSGDPRERCPRCGAPLAEHSIQ